MNRIRQKGFSVIEMIIYITLLSMFIIVLTQIFVSSLDIQLESQGTSEVEQDGRYILLRMLYDLKRADSVSNPLSPGTSGQMLEFISDGSQKSYILVNGNLILQDITGSQNLNSTNTNVSALNFTKYGNISGKDSIRINFTVTSKTLQSKGYESRNYQSTINLR